MGPGVCRRRLPGPQGSGRRAEASGRGGLNRGCPPGTGTGAGARLREGRGRKDSRPEEERGWPAGRRHPEGGVRLPAPRSPGREGGASGAGRRRGQWGEPGTPIRPFARVPSGLQPAPEFAPCRRPTPPRARPVGSQGLRPRWCQSNGPCWSELQPAGRATAVPDGVRTRGNSLGR